MVYFSNSKIMKIIEISILFIIHKIVSKLLLDNSIKDSDCSYNACSQLAEYKINMVD